VFSIISNCIQLLVQDLEAACESALTAMTKVNYIKKNDNNTLITYNSDILFHNIEIKLVLYYAIIKIIYNVNVI